MARIVIFGANSAMAAGGAREWIARGDELFLVGRNPQKLSAIDRATSTCARAPDQIVAARAPTSTTLRARTDWSAQARQALGGLDVALVAHGALPDQKACEGRSKTTMVEIEDQRAERISLLTLLANLFERRAQGRDRRHRLGRRRPRTPEQLRLRRRQRAWSRLLPGLRNRLAKSGVTVTLIKPGFVDTPMTASSRRRARCGPSRARSARSSLAPSCAARARSMPRGSGAGSCWR